MFTLDLGEQDPFFERVYAAARRVGWGRTTTYGALAKELGAGPEAARDVGQAMAKNPVALQFFPKLAAFNIGWRERPMRRIDSFIKPRGCLTRPGMANHAGDHSGFYPSFPALRTG